MWHISIMNHCIIFISKAHISQNDTLPRPFDFKHN